MLRLRAWARRIGIGPRIAAVFASAADRGRARRSVASRPVGAAIADHATRCRSLLAANGDATERGNDENARAADRRGHPSANLAVARVAAIDTAGRSPAYPTTARRASTSPHPASTCSSPSRPARCESGAPRRRLPACRRSRWRFAKNPWATVAQLRAAMLDAARFAPKRRLAARCRDNRRPALRGCVDSRLAAAWAPRRRCRWAALGRARARPADLDGGTVSRRRERCPATRDGCPVI